MLQVLSMAQITPQIELLQTKFYYFTVAASQESGSSLAACLWLRVCHEAVVKLLPRDAVISRLGQI